MTATIPDKPWDFSQVLELVNSLQPKAPEHLHFETGNKEKEAGINGYHSLSPSQGLGDFTKIFEYLGTPVKQQTSELAVQPPSGNDLASFGYVTKDEYVSDGATYSKSTNGRPKTVQFDERVSNEEQATTDAVSDSSLTPDTPTLTKKQRKKIRQREKRAKQAALAEERVTKKADTSISESEAEIARKTPARKASAHSILNTPSPRYNLRQRDASGKAITSIPDESFEDAVSTAVRKVQSAKKVTSEHSPFARSDATPTLYIAPDIPPSSWSKSYLDVSAASDQQGDHSTFYRGSAAFVPSSVQPLSKAQGKRSFVQYATTANGIAKPTKSAFAIQPMTIRSGEDRHWALLMKLIRDFYEDRRHLIAPMNLTTHNNDPKGIHVFVDASNIFIGFTEQLKLAREIHPKQPVPAVDLSFDALALLIERRRPVAKRVLVGSTPHLPAFDKAKAVGYECNILEKVYKAKELTERMVYFRDLDRGKLRSRARAPPANNVATLSGNGNGSGSETNAPQYAPPRMIEQGVDEILHLKILESIVDTDVPGTMVLATGDAAQAEYSGGFMVMAERALKKGWNVELVSWSKNISAMYTKRAWTEAWGDRFRIVLLDDYAEELLDM
jgi:hypothetical protein